MFDVAVIGAGVVGAFVARELTKYNLRVAIIEKASDVAMGSTRANSAIVHAGFDAKEGTLKAKLNVRGSLMMEEVCRELGVKYKRCGSLVVGFSEEDEKTLAGLYERGVENGVPDMEMLKGDEVRRVEGGVGDGVTVALFAKSGAIVCPYELCISAVGNAMDNGAELYLNFPVTSIEKNDGGYKIKSDSGEIDARFVVNCAGLYSDEIAKMVGDDSFTVSPRRGEYLLLDKEAGNTVSHTIFRCPSPMGKGILVSPTVDGNLLLGPTAENITDKEDTSTTAAGLDSVKRKATEQVKGVDLSKVITSFTGLRSVGSTGDFIIKESGERFLSCAGIESPGLSSAPAIGEYAVELLRDMGLEFSPRDDFDPIRPPMHFFSQLSDEEKGEIIKERPEFARIICRCEMVSEGEILDAIRTNPKPTDLDGVKRRTRATMGRCQGGFCSPYIIGLLAREMGVDYGDVTKFGGNSKINLLKIKENER